MYKFNLLRQTKNTDNHLTTKEEINSFQKGKIDINDLQFSELPEIITNIESSKLNDLQEGETLKFTQTTTITVEIEKYGR